MRRLALLLQITLQDSFDPPDAGTALRIAILVCDVPSEPIPSKYGDYSKVQVVYRRLRLVSRCPMAPFTASSLRDSSSPLQLIGNLLRRAQDGLKVDVESFDCRVGQYPADIGKYHGVAITGSRHGPSASAREVRHAPCTLSRQ